MIPSNSNTLNGGDVSTTINTVLEEDNIREQPISKTEEKQVVINNFYIPSGDGGWKCLETGRDPARFFNDTRRKIWTRLQEGPQK